MGDNCGIQRYDTHSSTGESKCNNRSASVVYLNRSSDSPSKDNKFSTKKTNSGICNVKKPQEKSLSQEAKKELIWWVRNLKMSNGRSLVNSEPQIIIASDASIKG